jgi:hypothetical protein
VGSVKILHEATRQTLNLEVVKRAVRISSRLRKVSDWSEWSAPSETKGEATYDRVRAINVKH